MVRPIPRRPSHHEDKELGGQAGDEGGNAYPAAARCPTHSLVAAKFEEVIVVCSLGF